MQIEIHSDPGGFETLAGEWNELLHDSAVDTIFLTLQWQSIWWHHLGDGILTLVVLRDKSGRLVGLAPLRRTPTEDGGWELTTVGCVDVSDYVDIMARRGHEETVYAALLDWLTGQDAVAWDSLRLCNIRQNSPTLQLLAPMTVARGLQVTQQVQEVCPIVALGDSWDEYLAGLSGKERRELRRKLRRATPHAGVNWTIVGPEHDLPSEMETFLDQMALSHPEKARFLHDRHRAFMHAIAQAAWDAGWLELAFLYIDGEPAAGMLNFAYQNRTLLYNSGLDAARFLRYSPGIVLTALLIRHSIEAGREAFDFLRGDEEYKYKLGGADTTIHQLLIRKST